MEKDNYSEEIKDCNTNDIELTEIEQLDLLINKLNFLKPAVKRLIEQSNIPTDQKVDETFNFLNLLLNDLKSVEKLDEN